MAFITCKGTILKQDIASTLTAVAQVISLDFAESTTETYEADTLDNANSGIPMKPTGRATGGSLSGELFFDPVLAGHQSITDFITTPALRNMSITFADTAATVWTFVAAGCGLGVRVALNDGLKANFSYTLDGLPAFAT
jgi:hypothetical protein